MVIEQIDFTACECITCIRVLYVLEVDVPSVNSK